MTSTTTPHSGTQVRHPLDPLSADESGTTAAILRRDRG